MKGKNIEVPSPGLVVLSGAPGSGKTTFARKHFSATEVLSSDAFRGAVSDDEHSTEASADAFWLMHETARRRLRHRRLTVIDATTASREAREGLRALATECHAQMSAIVFDLPIETALERNAARDRVVPERALRRLHRLTRSGAKHLRKMTRGHTAVVTSAQEQDSATVERVPLHCDRRDDHGPFDIVGDVHGCLGELLALVNALGYECGRAGQGWRATHPEGRRLVFVGDLVDRGPANLECLRFARDTGAYVIEGNHEAKMRRALKGHEVKRTHGLEETLREVEAGGEEAAAQARAQLEGLPSHVVLDGGRLVVAHAGLPEAMQLGVGGKVDAFAKYGETDGESDVYGLPVRHAWAERYEGRAAVVYGHSVVPEAQWIGNTICIDTGCVFGGALTALRWPERETVSVKAERTYYEPVRPIETPQEAQTKGLMRIEDVTGTQRVETRTMGSIRIDAGHMASAVSVATRFALPAQWLAYIPATMAPCEAAREGARLERPEEAFDEYQAKGVRETVCEIKHMGSRAIVIAGRDAGALARTFGVHASGTVYTRTGRRFFDDRDERRASSTRCAQAWSALDCGRRSAPTGSCSTASWCRGWSSARALVNEHYDVPARAGLGTLKKALDASVRAGARKEIAQDTESLAQTLRERLDALGRFEAVVKDYKGREGPARYAPFSILAGEGKVWALEDRVLQMETLAKLCAGDETLVGTPWRLVDVEDEQARATATRWWEEITSREGREEGMVVKPRMQDARGGRGRQAPQPALKVRGREYLRIIYGPDYTREAHLERLRKRGTGAKRALAAREHALGMEGLARVVEGAPLHRRYVCALGVLGLESEPVDPRL